MSIDAAAAARAAKEVAKRAAREAARAQLQQMAAAQVPPLRLTGPCGRMKVAVNGVPVDLRYHAVNDSGRPVSFTLRPTSPERAGGFTWPPSTSRQAPLPLLPTGGPVVPGRYGLPTPALPPSMEGLLRTSTAAVEAQYMPPRDSGIGTVSRLEVEANDGSETRRLTLDVELTAPMPPGGALQRFEPDKTGFSWPNMMIAGYLCWLADKPVHPVIVGLADTPRPRGLTRPGLDINGFIGSTNSAVVVFCRGTDPYNVANYVRHAQVDAVPAFPLFSSDSAAEVHAGWLDAADDLRSQVHTFVTEASQHLGRKPPIWLFGHSLGGAVATLLASSLSLRPDGHRVQGVITLGAPSPGNQAFAADYRRRVPNHIRVVNGEDPVPRLLPPFVPLGTCYYIGADSRVMRQVSGDDAEMAAAGVGKDIGLAALGLAGGALGPPGAATTTAAAMALWASHLAVWHDVEAYWQFLHLNALLDGTDPAGLAAPGTGGHR